MRRRTARDHGFLLCLGLNLLFRFEWCALALLYLGVALYFRFPLFPCFILLGIWFLYGLAVTLLFSFANHMGNTPTPQNENKNPYSKSASDYLPKE